MWISFDFQLLLKKNLISTGNIIVETTEYILPQFLLLKLIKARLEIWIFLLHFIPTLALIFDFLRILLPFNNFLYQLLMKAH